MTIECCRHHFTHEEVYDHEYKHKVEINWKEGRYGLICPKCGKKWILVFGSRGQLKEFEPLGIKLPKVDKNDLAKVF